MNRLWPGTTAALLAVGALGCGLALLVSMGSIRHTAAATTPEVTVRLFQFRPAALTVPPDHAVAWTNADDIEHTVTPGTYHYFCERHPSMTGDLFIQ